MFGLVRYVRKGNGLRAGVVHDGVVYDVADHVDDPALADIAVLLERLGGLIEALDDRPSGPGEGRLADLAPQVPLPPEASVFCAAANYTDHMLAMATKLGIPPESDPHEMDVKPYHFLKAGRQSLVPDGSTVAAPSHADLLDYEIELAAVIGTPARNVSAAEALGHVAGYTIANDLSARDRALMKRPNVPDTSLFRTDFIGMKSFDGCCPIGPMIVPAAFIDDPQALAMQLSVNGTLRQDSSTAKMVFSTAEQIAQLSTRMTLLPGDVVLTGTPAGTAAEGDGSGFLKPGDVITCEIEGLGRLVTTLAA